MVKKRRKKLYGLHFDIFPIFEMRYFLGLAITSLTLGLIWYWITGLR